MSCLKFIATSLAVRTQAHLLHLSSTSYAHHMALNEFYEGMIPLVDKYAEVYMGLNGQVKFWPNPAPIERKDAVDLVEDYLELVQAEQEEDEEESEALENILAGLEELTAQTLYKLRFLK